MRIFWFLYIVCLGIDFNALGQKNKCLITEGQKILGIKESPGQNNRSPDVDKIVLAAGGRPGQPWCGWTARYLHLKCGCPAGGGMAMSWFVSNRLIHTQFVPGDVFSIWNRYIKRIGHVGLVEQVLPSGSFIVTIEGNTNAVGSREGSGVCRLTRPIKQIHNFARWWK